MRRQTFLFSKTSARSFAAVKAVPEIDNDARMLKTTFNLPDPASMGSCHQLTKIVATIGPTSEQKEPLKNVVEAGMKIMRLNFSHATTEEVELRLKNLSLSQDSYDLDGPIDAVQDVRATLLDTRGPEIRTGKLAHDDSGHETISVQKDATITLQTSNDYAEASTEKDLFIDYPKLYLCMNPGMKVLLDDGAVILTITQINENDGSVVCTIDNSGELRSRAGVNLPGAETDLPAMSEKDKKDIKYGLEIDVDYVAASFIQTADGVTEIRNYMKACADEMGLTDRPLPLIISKIESQSALKHFDDILKESDGIMVARGDLGVEIPIHQVTNAQKEMIAACNAVGKPVIVATQMLESMAKNPRPTRAEVSDVTNAVYDGADAVMTSGETAKGKYPDLTIKTMNDIILSAEQYAASGSLASLGTFAETKNFAYISDSNDPLSAVAKGAVVASTANDCKAIVLFTETGKLPSLVAAYRPTCPIISFCPTHKVARQLILRRGIYPVVGLQNIENGEDKLNIAMKEVERTGFAAKGDSIVGIYAGSDGINFKLSQVK
jgi:pyruvate kinase